MPGSEHEAIAQLFRTQPEFAAEVLRDRLDIPVPEFTGVRLDSEDFTEWRGAFGYLTRSASAS
jgi:hypothetical protein